MRQIHISSSITNRESAAVESYLNELGRIDLISPDQEVQLALRIRAGDAVAQEKLVNANLRFVVSVAKKYQHQGLPLADLIAEGNLGLIKAATRFDETKGFKFISFAVWWIRQSIQAAVTENARIIRLPMNKIGEIRNIRKARTALEQEGITEPSIEQIACYLQYSTQRVKEALDCSAWTESYDKPVGEDEFTLLDKIADTTLSADHSIKEGETGELVKLLLHRLSERERLIIKMTFGIDCDWEMSPVDIADRIGISAERVRQLRNDALKKLASYAAQKKYRAEYS